MTVKLNRCWFDAADAGTGDFVYDQTKAGYLSPSNAGATDGLIYTYIAEVLSGGVPTQWEIGSGVWTASTTTLARTTVIASSNGGAAVDFSDPPNVRMGVALAVDVAPLIVGSDGDSGETISITAGNGLTDTGGGLTFTTGEGAINGGTVTFQAGGGSSNQGGGMTFNAGPGGGSGGDVQFTAGNGNSANGGSVQFTSGVGAVNGGQLTLLASDGDNNGGDVSLTPGNGNSGRNGLVIINRLPTSDPGVSGALYVLAGALMVSP